MGSVRRWRHPATDFAVVVPPFRLLTVITVTYNSASLVVDALTSAQEAAPAAGVAVEIVVVDNASTDQSVEVVRGRFPEARVVVNDTNVGFARANNQAFQVAQGDVWILLNPDASLAPGALVPLLDFLATHPGAGAVAPAIATAWSGGPESGGMAPGLRSMAGHFLLLNRLLPGDRGGPWRGVMLQRRHWLGPRRVEWLGGAALALRPEAVRDVDGFAPRFFLYGEDIDLGERLGRAGWELWIVPAARATHLIAGSQGRLSARWVDAGHDHYASTAPAGRVVVYDCLIAIGLSGRALVWSILDRSDEGRIHARTMLMSSRTAWSSLGRTLGRLGRGQRP